MSSEKQSKFSIWYNSPGGKRLVGAIYSLGAAVVIIGALFKIMHWPASGYLLAAGMFTEAILFGIGVFEKPHKEYDWDRVFAFDGKHSSTGGMIGGGAAQTMQSPEKLADAEIVSLTEGIRNLSTTAKQLSTISTTIGATDEFAKNINSATEATAKYATVQTALNNATGKLFASYDSLNSDMNLVVDGTKQYAGKVEDINKNLSSLNSVYEIQLKNIQSQNEAISKQTATISNQAESTRLVAESLNEITAENQKITQLTKMAAEEANKYKDASAQLASQISELNKVYGNMLNALS